MENTKSTCSQGHRIVINFHHYTVYMYVRNVGYMFVYFSQFVSLYIRNAFILQKLLNSLLTIIHIFVVLLFCNSIVCGLWYCTSFSHISQSLSLLDYHPLHFFSPLLHQTLFYSTFISPSCITPSLLWLRLLEHFYHSFPPLSLVINHTCTHKGRHTHTHGNTDRQTDRHYTHYYYLNLTACDDRINLA